MKIKLLLALLSIVVTESFSQVSKSSKAFTNVHHYRNDISCINNEGERATIFKSPNSARLVNADGSQSSIDFFEGSSTLFAVDGTISTVMHNGPTSTVYNADGTRTIINHQQSSSSCLTEHGKHNITHTFGNVREMRSKNKIDVLLHMNWYIRTKYFDSVVDVNAEEPKKN